MQARSLAVSGGGRRALLALDGKHLQLGEAPPRPLEGPALCCRFAGEDLVLLEADGSIHFLGACCEKRAAFRPREGATCLAPLPSGSLLVAYGEAGAGAHGILLDRLGPRPVAFRGAGEITGALALAVESGAYWMLGPGRALRLRPVPAGLRVTESVELPAPPRAATIGPDSALYVLLEPGSRVVRIWSARVGECPAPGVVLLDLARERDRLLGCGPQGVVDLAACLP